MGEKWKKVRTRIIDWFKDIIAIIRENMRVFIILIVFLLAIVAAIVITSELAKKTSVTEEIIPVSEEVVSEELTIPEEALEEDAYPEINDLMNKYYTASANGDVATIEGLRTGIDDKERIVIEKKAEYVASYPVVKVYTKKGPTEDSFLAFIYYEVVIEGYEEQIPGLNVWYVCKRDDGSYYINEDTQDEKVADYCKVISVQDDVVDLSNTVNVKFNDIMTANEELAAYMDELAVQMKVSVGEELAKVEAGATEEAEEEEVVNEPVEEETVTSEEPEEITVKKVKATTVVNVRSSDSEKADKMGKAQEGQEFTLLEEKVNGWSKIEFEGKEAYIKTEFLETISENKSTKTEDTSKADKVNDEEAAKASPSKGTATVKETINVRKAASTSSDKLGVCYAGDKLEVVEKQDDGWSKVKYNGKTGFVKSEYLE